MSRLGLEQLIRLFQNVGARVIEIDPAQMAGWTHRLDTTQTSEGEYGVRRSVQPVLPSWPSACRGGSRAR